MLTLRSTLANSDPQPVPELRTNRHIANSAPKNLSEKPSGINNLADKYPCRRRIKNRLGAELLFHRPWWARPSAQWRITTISKIFVPSYQSDPVPNAVVLT